jgi:hypothetical protein
MTLDWTIIISTFIGAFLASGTGYLFERKRENVRMAQARILLITAIADDLKYAISLYDKVAEEWEKTKIVWFATLNEIRESRFTYQNNKDWIHVFGDPELRRRIFRYYLQSAERVNNLEYQQRRVYEIRARLNDTIRDIKQKDPNLDDEVAIKLAISYMKNESSESENLQNSIPESIARLSEFKLEAKELARLLESAR